MNCTFLVLVQFCFQRGLEQSSVCEWVFMVTHIHISQLGWHLWNLLLPEPTGHWTVTFEIFLSNVPKDLFWRVWLVISVFTLQPFVDISWHWSLWRCCGGTSQASRGVHCHAGDRKLIPAMCSLTAAKRARCAMIKPQHKSWCAHGRASAVPLLGWYFHFHVMQRNCFFRWEDTDRRRNVGNKQIKTYMSRQQDLSAGFADKLDWFWCASVF